jgi:hypothetical protein
MPVVIVSACTKSTRELRVLVRHTSKLAHCDAVLCLFDWQRDQRVELTANLVRTPRLPLTLTLSP